MATATLRIINAQVTSSSSVDVTFNYTLTSNLVPANVSIISDTPNVPDSAILQLSVSGSVLSITCQPLTEFASYFLQFQNTTLNPFTSLHGEAKISQDGVSNKILINGPIDPDNPVRNYLGSFYKDNIYNISDDSTVVGNYINALSTNLARALYDIRQSKNENYLSFTVIDEVQARGAGPFDRLNEEGAYEILRVGRGPTSALVSTTFAFENFPSYPITLQRQQNTETLDSNSIDEPGVFNINSLTLNLNNTPVTKVNSIIFTLSTSSPTYVYDIDTLGYQIQSSRYDQDFGFSYAQLNPSQIRLSDKILSDPNFALDKIFKVDVEYETKDLGRVVDPNTVTVFTNPQTSREVLPPIINIFALKHAPITDSSNNISTVSGVVFTDPNSNVPGSLHPAFLYEIPYRLSSLPAIPGQYAIDYLTGTIYVYGSDSKNDGTGPFPPLATYNYRLTYVSEIDYVFDSDSSDLVSLPDGSLVDFNGSVTFSYEEVFIPGVDYIAELHNESLTERVNNNVVALNAIKTQNSPITNVFRIYNETSGEIYTLDRWYGDIIYFRYNNPPRVVSQLGERVKFLDVTNELLFVNTTIINGSSIAVFKILLNNNNIIGSTEDGIGSSFNSSASFTNGNVFKVEKWFDVEEDEFTNINRLTSVGQYVVDYVNGIVYCAVSNIQSFDIGSVTYKKDSIDTQFPHIISVEDLYYRISILNPKNKEFPYISFDDSDIVPNGLESLAELYLNNTSSAPYQVFNNAIGAFVDSSFLPGVTNQVKFVRSVFEHDDLLHSTSPLNFASTCTSSGFNINVGSLTGQTFENVKFDGVNYYVTLNINLPYLSSNIDYNFSVIRVSDSEQLWDNSGVILPGGFVELVLSGANSPSINDLVNVSYTFTINPVSRVVIDYNKGDYFADYTYIADEIIISYEWGDNALDFRTSKTIPYNTQYYVSYRVGALRDALLKNFGTLVNVPELANFDINFDRERYREALQAALGSFVQGPTLAAIKNIGKTISHIEPEVNESFLQGWSLGTSLLNPEPIQTDGAFQLLPAKFGNGVLVDSADQTIKFKVNDNLRFEEGTFETWLSPQWDGLDNDANLVFNILKGGLSIDPSVVFIGSSEYHPNIITNQFSVNKNNVSPGKPNTNKDGVFIYYDLDMSGSFHRWYVEVIDGYDFGNSQPADSYKFKINSNGKFYDLKSINYPQPSNMSVFTGLNSANITLGAGGQINEGVTFVSDVEHYLLDFGLEPNRSRLSIYKDVSGYMNFRVFGQDKTPYAISADVSDWQKNSLHQVAASWKLNTRNSRDELHLFIDGVEVPNIIKYSQKLKPYLHEKIRTVDPEEIVGLLDRDIVESIDLVTIAGSDLVTSSIDFSAFEISVGDIISIEETGFDTNGYVITNINGQSLTLNHVMPQSITNGVFSVNKTSFIVTSDIDIAPNVAVTTIHTFTTGSDLSTFMNSSTVTSTSKNFTILGVKPGYMLRIDDPSLNIGYTIVQVIGNSLVIADELPSTLTNASFQIYSNIENEIPGTRALRPAYSITKNSNFDNVLTISNDSFAGDLILVRTLGLNHRNVDKRYYVWSNQVENVLMTQVAPPISLDEVKITKVILPSVTIGLNNPDVTPTGGHYLYSTSTGFDQPINSQNGRTLNIKLIGTNVDFSASPNVTVTGIGSTGAVTDTVVFNDYGIMSTTDTFISVSNITANIKPVIPNKNAAAIEIKEKYSMTHSESSGLVATIRFSYPVSAGYNLHSDGYIDGYQIVTDGYKLFSGDDVGNYLLINSPISVAGFYNIMGVSTDRHSLFVTASPTSFNLPLTPFTDAMYQVLNVSDYRSGFQNGFFTFEDGYMPGQAYYLGRGFYDLDYSTYTRIKMDPINSYAFVGSDLFGHNQVNGIVNEMKIYSVMLTDTRIGETALATQRTITKDFNSLKPLKVDSNTLMLVSFSTFPFSNQAKFYINTNGDGKHFQSSLAVNDNFGQSLVILDEPVIVSNDGILDTKKQGTIEFWVNPIYDAGNDPNSRFYFDAYGATIEETVSVNSTSVKISAPASQILSVTLKAGDPRVDYFAGGKLEIDTQRAIREEGMSISNSSVMVTHPILQVITVKIVGDLTGTDYFAGGSIGTNQQTIYLGKLLPETSLPLIVTYQTTSNNNKTLNSQIIRLNKKLPYQNSKVVVKYIPKGSQGDRISIYKDKSGYLNFGISASGNDFVISAPVLWSKGTWHRVKASYKINGGNGTDEMRLFIDGYEYYNVTFGENIIFGSLPQVFGGTTVGDGYTSLGNITFKDPINSIFIGSAYDNTSPIFSLIDNFRISNISRPIYAPYGEAIDVNYSSNQSIVFPVTQDLYTTYLFDFNVIKGLNTSFATIVNRETGGFDFSVNILDSFGIVSSSPLVKEVLEELINVLKPANSRVVIQYTT